MFDFGDNVDRDKSATKCKFDFVDRVDGKSIILVFPALNNFAKFWLNGADAYKFHDFRPISNYVVETKQDRAVVNTER